MLGRPAECNSNSLNNSSYSKLYATDASVYEHVPEGVIFPRNVADIIPLLNRLREQGKGLICRGGGTSIAGQCVGDGYVIDFSRNMASILSDPKDGSIWVQPGVVLDDLNDYLRPFGMQFPIDISTSSRCTIGGMVGNNAAGSHSIVYGSTRENVLEVQVILSDASEVRFGPIDAITLSAKRNLPGVEGNIYRAVFDAIDNHRDAIFAAFPDKTIIRRNTGYALDVLAGGQPWVAEGAPFNLASLICGSEGTLALVTAIRLKLAPQVGGKALACIHFDSLDAAFRANTRLLTCEGLASCELLDKHILRAAADHPGQRAYRSWVVGDPAAVLAAEFFASTPAEARRNAERAATLMQSEGLGVAWPVLDGTDAPKVWALRKAGLGLLMGLRQRARPVAVIEDSAVPAIVLPDFARDIDHMMTSLGIDCVYYGHASVGLLHLRPALDLDNESDRATFSHIAAETAALVKRYRGSLSGEHGDGRLRAPYLREFLGEGVYSLLVKVKNAFDPSGIFNPGKIIADLPVDANLRRRPYGAMAAMQGGIDWHIDGGFDLVLERCNGSGNCRQRTGRGAMCPTFQASGEELHSTRGRANLLRQAFFDTSLDALDDPLLIEAMDSCLGCKACSSECPSGVDMTLMKADYLYRRHRKSQRGQRWLVGNQTVLIGLLERSPVLLRRAAERVMTSSWVMRLAGLERQLPALAPLPLSRIIEIPRQDAGSRIPVLLLVDVQTNHLEPEVGKAAMAVMRLLGYEPRLHFMDSSPRLMVSEGLLIEARKSLRHLAAVLRSYESMPIIGLEPSELLLLRNEASRLLGNDWPEEIVQRCMGLDEFLLHEHAGGRLRIPARSSVIRSFGFHPHCHERAVGGGIDMIKSVGELFGFEVELVSTGCCGMGGAFGYRHGALSKQIFSNNVRMDSSRSEAILVSGCGCRQQFRDFGRKRVLHLAELLCDLLVTAPSTRGAEV